MTVSNTTPAPWFFVLAYEQGYGKQETVTGVFPTAGEAAQFAGNTIAAKYASNPSLINGDQVAVSVTEFIPEVSFDDASDDGSFYAVYSIWYESNRVDGDEVKVFLSEVDARQHVLEYVREEHDPEFLDADFFMNASLKEIAAEMNDLDGGVFISAVDTVATAG